MKNTLHVAAVLAAYLMGFTSFAFGQLPGDADERNVVKAVIEKKNGDGWGLLSKLEVNKGEKIRFKIVATRTSYASLWTREGGGKFSRLWPSASTTFQLRPGIQYVIPAPEKSLSFDEIGSERIVLVVDGAELEGLKIKAASLSESGPVYYGWSEKDGKRAEIRLDFQVK
jgi:hypothetical protein